MKCVNMRMSFREFFTIFSMLVLVHTVCAQRTAVYNDPDFAYSTGVDLYEKEKYGAAQKQFQYVIENDLNPLSQLRISAEYYDAICALELFNRDAEYKFKEFVRKHPTNSRVNLIQFQMGRLAYRNKKYSSAIRYFEKTDVMELTSDQLDEYNFKTGYCYFKTNDLEKSKLYFEKVIGHHSKYRSPANYYLAHIAYADKDYETALAMFEKLREDKNFSAIVPYYLVQILFVQEKYDEVLKVAPDLYKNATDKRKPEIARIIGESYYRKNKFTDALPYMYEYHKGVKVNISREDYYAYAFTLYKTGKFNEAVSNFQRVTGKKDELAQYAYYYLADCYLKIDQKKFAAKAFNSAWKLPFDRDIREDALFNQAKLAYELSYDPYSEAIKALKKYLINYPNSSRNDEAYSFLFKISLATNNFQDAYTALESIKVRGKDYDLNYQKISYFLGIELFNRFEYEESLSKFKIAIAKNIDKSVTAEALFWTGEAMYRQGNYPGAKKYYLDFLSAPKAKKLPVYNLANYNLGYVYFKQEEYNGAIYYLKEFIAKLKNENPAMVADAFLRLGDSWFIRKGYDNAIKYYDKAIKMETIDVDYALFQKAIALGVLQRYNEKIQVLNTIIANYPNTSSMSEVIYELGNTYLVINDQEKALISFRKVSSEHSGSSFAIKARLKSGLIYYNNGQNELALSTFKKVVSDYPNTPESKEALASIKNIYVDINKVDDYLAYVDGLPFTTISVTEQDSMSYIAAENLYMDGEYSAAAESLDKYIRNFPEGAFKLNASFYLAECQYKEGNLVDALINFEYVLSRPKSEFTESAMLKAATIAFKLSEVETALGYFTKLETNAENKLNITEAHYGMMKCNYLLENYDGALATANKLLAAEKLSDEMKLEALVIKANSLYKSDELLLAKSAFKEVIGFSQGEAGAEAKYMVANIEYQISDLDASEKDVFELINQYAPYDYWVARGFILLADIYLKKDNVFQAKQTLQSIIDNYEGEELKGIAINKLQDIIKKEKALEVELIKADEAMGAPDTIHIDENLIE